jgi:acetoacetyl-CoA synthetase
MMWNWLISSLGAGATIVLYDGNPNYPDAGAMWKMTQDEKITIFGLSATYVNYLRSEGLRPGKEYDLSSLREISQTGSPLSAEGFEYVYQEIKQDLHFNSIAGGTDINGCFAVGSPIQPVYAGELQSPRESHMGSAGRVGMRGSGSSHASLFLERSKRGKI